MWSRAVHLRAGGVGSLQYRHSRGKTPAQLSAGGAEPKWLELLLLTVRA
jgi:hypothetical protein